MSHSSAMSMQDLELESAAAVLPGRETLCVSFFRPAGGTVVQGGLVNVNNALNGPILDGNSVLNGSLKGILDGFAL